MNYELILKAVLENFIECEGTDYLSGHGTNDQPLSFLNLPEPERLELLRIRDEVRKHLGWEGY